MKVILTIIFLVSAIFAKIPNQDTVDVAFGAYNFFRDTKNANGQVNYFYLDGRLMSRYGYVRDEGIVLDFPASMHDGSYHILESKFGGPTGLVTVDRWIIHLVIYTSIERNKVEVNKSNTFICRYDVLGRKVSSNKYSNRIITKKRH